MKSHETSELRSAIARLRATEREKRTLQLAFDAGHKARLSGAPGTACLLRRPDRRNAWLRGWQDADWLLSENEAVRAMTPAERAKGRAAMAALREKLPFLGRAVPTGTKNDL